MWLGSHVAVVAALMPPLAWELPYDAGAAVKKKKLLSTLYVLGTVLVQQRRVRCGLGLGSLPLVKGTEQRAHY